MNRRSLWIGPALLMLLGLSWGLSFSLVKMAAGGFSAVAIVALPGATGALVLLATCRAQGRWPGLDWASLRFYGVCALLSSVGPFMVSATVAPHLDAGTLTLIGSMPPVFTYAFAVAAGLERITVMRLTGLAFGLASAAVLLAPGAQFLDPAKWVLAALTAPLLYGAYHVAAARLWPAGATTAEVSAGAMTVGVLVLAPVATLGGHLQALAEPWGGAHVGLVGLMILIPLDALLFFEIIRRSGPYVATQANFIGVVSGVGFAVFVLGETPGSSLWLSAILLVMALGLSLAPQPRPKTVE